MLTVHNSAVEAAAVPSALRYSNVSELTPVASAYSGSPAPVPSLNISVLPLNLNPLPSKLEFRKRSSEAVMTGMSEADALQALPEIVHFIGRSSLDTRSRARVDCCVTSFRSERASNDLAPWYMSMPAVTATIP